LVKAGIKGGSDAFFILGSLLEKIVADPFDCCVAIRLVSEFRCAIPDAETSPQTEKAIVGWPFFVSIRHERKCDLSEHLLQQLQVYSRRNLSA